MNSIRAMGVREYTYLGVLSILWGGSFVFIKLALTGLPPLWIVFFRVFVGGMILLGYSRILGNGLPRNLRIWGSFFVMGVLNNVIPFIFITWGQQFVPAGLASLLNASTPFFTVIVAHLVTQDEKLNLPKISGVCIGFVGVAILIGVDSFRRHAYSLKGELAIIGAAISYALAGAWGRRFQSLNIPPLITATGQLICSSTVLLVILILTGTQGNFSCPSFLPLGAVLGLSFLSTALAYVLYFHILSTSGATNMLLVTFLIPVTTILLGVFFFR
ncbi:MAG: DMT family transporter, partial [Spirochaetales bacterium]